MARATIDLPDGRRYEGEVDENLEPHGHGVMTKPDGRRFEDTWRNGAFIGEPDRGPG